MWPASQNDWNHHRQIKAVLNMNKIVATAALTAALLQGCSGHPGAGHWQASADSSTSQYSALELEFDGKGTLHPNKSVIGQENKTDLWCLWQAKSATELDVQCGDGSAEKTNVKFELIVTGNKQQGAFSYVQANLLQDGSIVTIFDRKF